MAKTRAKINPKTSERLIELLNEKGKNQAWLAMKIPVSPAMVSKWVKGRAGMTKDNAEICSKILGCSPAYILGFSDYKTDEEEEKARSDRFKQRQELIKEKKKIISDLVNLSCKTSKDADWIYLAKGGVAARLYRHQLDELSEGLLDVIDVYIDHFIKQHRYIIE